MADISRLKRHRTRFIAALIPVVAIASAFLTAGPGSATSAPASLTAAQPPQQNYNKCRVRTPMQQGVEDWMCVSADVNTAHDKLWDVTPIYTGEGIFAGPDGKTCGHFDVTVNGRVISQSGQHCAARVQPDELASINYTGYFPSPARTIAPNSEVCVTLIQGTRTVDSVCVTIN